MALYAIGDLHLSNHVHKPMDIFGSKWVGHDDKIKKDWLINVKEEDTVLIPGDISWGMNIEEAKPDIEWISELPGRKILLKGNHDYWWSSISKLKATFPTIDFLQNNFFTYKDYGICGTRGWISPNDKKFTKQDEKIYLREIHRLTLSLEAAKKANCEKIIVMLHYPPTNDEFETSLFIDTFQKYNVEMVVYGHLHGEEAYDAGLKGEHGGITYHLASCDFLGFKLLKLL